MYDDEDLDNQLNAIKNRIERSIIRAKRNRVEKAQSGNLENLKIAKAHDYRVTQNLEEDKKAQIILENLNATVEVSRQKRKEQLLKVAEKMSEKRNAKFEKIKFEILKEEEKMLEKEIEVENKEKIREKIRNDMKKWYAEQGQIISEINKLRKQDQTENFSKNQANLQEFKLKILFKHLTKEKTLQKLVDNRLKLEKIRNTVQSTLTMKKEKNHQELNHEIVDLYRKSNLS